MRKRLKASGVLALLGLGTTILTGGCSRNLGNAPPAAPLPASSGQSSKPTTPPSAAKNSSLKKPAKKPAPAAKIQWQPNLDAALKLARKTQKPIMIDFFTTWCGPCKMLDTQIYPAAPVVEEAKNFVSVKVDGDKHRDLIQKYQITGYPTIVFLSASGQEIQRTEGVSDQPAWFVGEMQTARAKVAPTAA